MIDDVLAGIFGEVVVGRMRASRRLQLVSRLLFGIIGGILAGVGCYGFALASAQPTNLPMRANMVALFLLLGCFSLFNVALARTWRWPGRLFLVSLAALFVTRILFGP